MRPALLLVPTAALALATALWLWPLSHPVAAPQSGPDATSAAGATPATTSRPVATPTSRSVVGEATDLDALLDASTGELPAAALHGTVTDADHRPVAGVRLSLQLPDEAATGWDFSGPAPAAGTATTDERGEYRLAPIPRRNGIRLWLRPPGGWLPESRELVDAPGERRLDIELSRVFPLRCVVLDARRRTPIADAQVRCGPSEPIARSGTDGALVLQVPLGVARVLEVGGCGYAPIRHPIELHRDDLEHPLVLLLVRGARVTGRVLDVAGVPVAGASLTLKPAPLAPGRTADRERAVRATLTPLAPGSVRLGGPWHHTVLSDGQGGFAFDGVAGQNGVFHGQLVAQHEGFCDALHGPVDLDEPAPDLAVVLTLFRGGVIEGTLRYQGAPCGGYIQVQFPGGNLTEGTDAQGGFTTAPIPPGRVTLIAQAAPTSDWDLALGSLRTVTRQVQVTEGGRIRVDLDIEAPVPGATALLAGRVRDTNGLPVPGILILYRRDDPGGSGGGLVPAPTDADGRWQLEVPTAEGRATYTLTAEAEGITNRHERIRPPRQDLDFERAGNGRVTLEITCADGGAPSGILLATRLAGPGPWSSYRKDLGERGTSDVLDPVETIELPGSALDLRIDALGHVPMDVLGVRATPAGQTLRVVVHRGHTVTLEPIGEVEALAQRVVVLVPADARLPEQGIAEGDLAGGERVRPLRTEGSCLQARTFGRGRYRLVSTDRDLVFQPELIEVVDRDVVGQVRITLRR